MDTKEIRSEDWEEICRRASELSDQSLLVVEILRPDGTQDQLGRDILFESMKLDRTDQCDDRILVEGRSAGKPFSHLILGPIHIRLKSNKNGLYNSIQIGAENGTTLLTFHPGFHPDLLQGLKA
jgi:hypothetical protein